MFDREQSLKLRFLIILIIIIMITNFFVVADDYCHYSLIHYQEMLIVYMTITVKAYLNLSVSLGTLLIHQNLDTPTILAFFK
jgi:hypothetical protein